ERVQAVPARSEERDARARGRARGDGAGQSPGVNRDEGGEWDEERHDRVRLAVLLADEGQEGQDPRALHGDPDLARVARARAGTAPRHDLPAVGDEPREALVLLVVDAPDLLQAQLAELPLQDLRGLLLAWHLLSPSLPVPAVRTAGRLLARLPGRRS